MERLPEPELMEAEDQALAYAVADFEGPNSAFVDHYQAHFPNPPQDARVVDLGCGPADICLRLARLFPNWRLDAVDGAEAMLAHGRRAIAEAGMDDRVRPILGRVPELGLPARVYDVVISNSLLHHLGEPADLWDTVHQLAAPGAQIQIMDLRRPQSREAAERLRELYVAEEAEVLQQDFFNSLLAAFTPEEVRQQLEAARLDHLQIEETSDRHMMIFGTMPR